jgi:hypothetical protein
LLQSKLWSVLEATCFVALFRRSATGPSSYGQDLVGLAAEQEVERPRHGVADRLLEDLGEEVGQEHNEPTASTAPGTARSGE